jgi:phosphatidylserine/phosphatidylglycerophosphate/cardiolipin synthase-like enzyme
MAKIGSLIWQSDEAGILLFDRLLKATDRGVRVCLLVDDLVFAAKDTENGLYIEPPNLAMELAREFDRMMAPENA